MATMENTEKRPVGRPRFVKNEMMATIKSFPVGEWGEIGVFTGQTAAQREKILREAQGNIETEVVLRARRVKGRAASKKRVKVTS